MTKSELFKILTETGFKVSSVRFNTAITPPYACYEVSSIKGLYANGINIGEITEFSIYFFKSKTDLESEKILESVLTKHKISYFVDLEYKYVEDENLELITYKFEDYQGKEN